MEWGINKQFYRPDEVARVLALSRRTVYRMIRDGRLPAVKWGSGPWRISREALSALLPPESGGGWRQPGGGGGEF